VILVYEISRATPKASVAPTGGRDNLLSRLRSSKSLLAEVHIWLKRSDARARHLLSLRDPDNKLSGPP
jgi:hypothetical protein